MSYIAKIIGSDEKLIAVARPHWIYLLTGFLWIMVFVSLGTVIHYYFEHSFEYTLTPNILNFILDLKIRYLGDHIPVITTAFTLIGIIISWPFFLTYVSAEIGLTNERIIYKTGLIFIEIDQVDLEDIRAERVYHGWMGWFLKYGTICLDCRFLQDVKLPAIRQPYRFVKASHHARLKHPSIDYNEDEFSKNLKHINKKQKENHPRQKIINLKNTIKKNFKQSA